MQDLLVVLATFNLSYILFDDLKSRSIHLLGFITYLLIALVWFYHYGDWLQLGLNAAFLTILLGLGILVVRTRKKMQLNHLLGSGDFLFLYITALFFDFPGFVVSLNAGLIFSLIVYLCFVKRFDSREGKLVPLAGLLSVVFAIALIFEAYVQPIRTIIHQS